MMKSMTPRGRIVAALRGDPVDRMPFSVYWLMLPRGEAERRLREAGVAIVERVPAYRTEMPGCSLVTHEYFQDGLRMQRETLRTPVGEVYSTRTLDPGYGTSWWTQDYYVKRPEDYPILSYAVAQSRYVPNYDAVGLAQERLGEDGYVIGNTEYGPLNKLIYDWLGVERFSLDLAGHPEELFALYELTCRKHREMYAVAARAPADLFIYDGNIHQDVVGRRRFERYIVPCLNAFADVVHEEGKWSACHLDAPLRTLIEPIAACRFDVVEAFTPPPNGDVTTSEALRAWPGKALWLNFPSSVLLSEPEAILLAAEQLVNEVRPGDRCLMGVTEDVPEHAWRAGLQAIADALGGTVAATI